MRTMMPGTGVRKVALTPLPEWINEYGMHPKCRKPQENILSEAWTAIASMLR